MSMDEQYRQMERFFKELRHFNEQLRISVSDLARSHNAVNPLWQDEFRKSYDAKWTEFEEAMARYINREAPEYEQFLHEKLIALQRYLTGR